MAFKKETFVPGVTVSSFYSVLNTQFDNIGTTFKQSYTNEPPDSNNKATRGPSIIVSAGSPPSTTTGNANYKDGDIWIKYI